MKVNAWNIVERVYYIALFFAEQVIYLPFLNHTDTYISSGTLNFCDDCNSIEIMFPNSVPFGGSFHQSAYVCTTISVCCVCLHIDDIICQSPGFNQWTDLIWKEHFYLRTPALSHLVTRSVLGLCTGSVLGRLGHNREWNSVVGTSRCQSLTTAAG